MKISELKELQFGSSVKGIYVLRNGGLKSSRGGDYFLTGVLQDNSGSIPAVQWDVTDTALYEVYLQKFQVFEISARLDTYKDAPQVVIEVLSPVEKVTPEILRTLLPTLPESEIGSYIEEIKKMRELIENEACYQLMSRMFEDKDFVHLFSQAPAAVMVHHAYCGGLAQHTAYVMRNAWYLYQQYKQQYPDLNGDVILLGAFFHDLGKMEEIRVGARFEASTEGQLLGHLVISLEMFTRLVESIRGFPPHLAMAIKHCIISHHGQQEWGAPVVPRTMEAEIIFLADYLDSTLRQFVETIQESGGENWSQYNRFLQRSVFSAGYERLPERGKIWNSKLFAAKSPEKKETKHVDKKNPPDFKKHSLF